MPVTPHTAHPTPLSPATLLPVLRLATWTEGRGLSDDGFSDTVASIALSRDLCATFDCGGVDVSYRGLGELNLSAHRAWDIAAANLVARARTDQGIRVLTRPSALLPGVRGLQVAMPGAAATSWLAHPSPFTILDEHLSTLLGEPVAWCIPSATTLVAVPRGGVEKHGAPGVPVWTGGPVEWRHGFPAAVTSAPRVGAPA